MLRFWGRATLAALTLSLAACGDNVKFPGLDDPSDQAGTAPDPEPAPTTDPVTDPNPDPAPEPVDDPVTGPGEDPVAPPDPEPEPDPELEPDTNPEPEMPVEPTFEYYAPGNLIPGSGQGSLSETIFAPDMIFPVATDPAIPQSQVFRPGGGLGPAGKDQCDASNYEVIWRDNFCETRSRFSSPYCPAGEGVHLGQDIRIGTSADCAELRRRAPRERTLHKIVAVEDGEISNIGRYTVTLKSGGRIYRYLHLNMLALQVSPGQEVQAGDHIGYMSNDFGGTATTFHLHFEIKVNDGENGWVFAPPYTSLLEAYAEREGNPGVPVENLIGVASAEEPVIIPEGMVIIE